MANAFNATSPTVPFVVTRKWSIHPLTPSWLNRIKTADPALATPEMIGAGPFPGEAPGKPGAVTVGGWGIATVAGAREREAGWDVHEVLRGRPGGHDHHRPHERAPRLAQVARAGRGGPDPLQKPYVEAMQRAEFAQFGFYVPVAVSFAPLDEAIAGKRTARDALDAMHREATDLYAEYKQRFKTQRRS